MCNYAQNLPKYYNVSNIDKPNAAIDALDALVTFQEVVVNNCDSTEGWECYPGDTLEFTDTKKTEGAESIHTSQSGGFVQGTALPNLNLTGIQSITFDFAAVTEMINTLPEIKYPLTEDMRTAIAAAKTAYGELDEIGKGRVENYTVLEEAEELVQLFDNLGNVDNEGVVTASDAQFVMQFVVKSAQLSDWQKQVADVNNDGKVNSIDALLILRYSKGMITEFPYNS